MCFSAEASFTVGLLAGLAGVATVHQVKTPALRWLAHIPYFFAIQQSAEGVVWLYLNGKFQPTPVSLSAQYLYLFFALVFWPSYVPWAIRIAETIPVRQKICTVALVAGLCVAMFNSLQLLTTEVSPTVVGHSIHYWAGDITQQATYGLVSLGLLFVSSIPRMWIMGALSVTAFAVSGYFFSVAFVSVWCFFAAVISIGLFFILNSQPTRNS